MALESSSRLRNLDSDGSPVSGEPVAILANIPEARY
jgi:hypothetical protein